MKKKKKHSFPTTPQLCPGTPKSTFCAMNDNAYRCSTPTTSRKHDHASYTPTAILKTLYSKPNDPADADINHNNNTPIKIGFTSKSYLFPTD